MLDIKLIRENPEEIKGKIARKGAEPALVDDILDLDKRRRDLTVKIEDLQSKLNKLSKDVVALHGQQKIDVINEASSISEKIKQLKPEVEKTNVEYKKTLYMIPNIPSDDTPDGPDESGNVPVKKVGEPRKFDFTPKEHWQLGEELDVIDIARATKVSGSRFNYLKGKLALLEFALIQYAYSVLTDEEKLKEIAGKAGIKDVNIKPFVPIVPPVFIKPEPFEKMARIEPREERYYLPNDDLFLIGSAEHTLGSMHMDETISEKEFPIRYAGFSPAFRREAGSYGKDMKGIMRVHQFDKLELESFTIPEDSVKEQDFIVAIQEYLIGSLGLPYQVVKICTGDMGTPDFRQIDIETWMPGQNCYRETNTSDLNTDYQSRRLNTRVKKEGKTEFVHMNDATAYAIGRTLIAIMENYQQKDGSIEIPEVLKKYTGFDVIKK